jgi:hypothetical protein
VFNPFMPGNPFANMLFPKLPIPATTPPPPPPPAEQVGSAVVGAMPYIGPLAPAISAAIGRPLQPQDLGDTALSALSLPGEAVRGTIGAGAKFIDPGHLGNLDNEAAFSTAMQRGIEMAGPSTPGPAGLLSRLPAPVSKFVTSALFDPLNFVGAGIPGRALTAGKLAKAGLTAEDLASAAAGLGRTPEALLADLAPQGGALDRTLNVLNSFEGGTQHLLEQLFQVIPNTAGAVGRQIPFSREVIAGINPDLTANVRQSRDLTDYLTAVGKHSYLKQFAGGLTDAVNQYKALGGDPLQLSPELLPSDLAATLTGQVQAGFDKHVKTLGNDQARVQKMFENLYQGRAQQAFPADQFSQIQGGPLEKLTGVLDALQIPHGDINSTVDLLNAVKTQLPDSEWNSFDKTVKSYPQGDLFKDNPLDLTLDRVIRDRAKTLGIEAPSGLRSAIGTGTALFSEQALQSLSYLLTNAGSGTLMGALEGVNPLKVMSNLAANVGSAAKGEPVFTSDARNLANALGLVDQAGSPLLPHDVSAAAAGMLNEATPTAEYTGRGLTASQRIGAPALAAGGGVLGGLSGYVSSPSDATPQESALNTLMGAGLGAAGGAAIPTLSKYLLQRFSRGIEDVLRQSAWELGTRSHLTNSGDQAEQIIRDAFSNGFPTPAPTPGVDVANTPTGQLVDMLRQQGVHPPTVVTGMNGATPLTEPNWQMLEAIKSGQFQPQSGQARVWADQLFNAANPVQGPTPTPNMPVEQFLNAVHSLDGMFSPQTLQDALTNTAGVHPDIAANAAKQWQDVIHEASRSGADLSNTIHFDYGNLNNLEEMVKQFVPFSTWTMKAFPFFAKHIAEHPDIMTSALELQHSSDQMRDETGLTSKVQGTLPMGAPMDAVWSMLLGRPVDTYTNPLRGLVPYSDTLKSLDNLDQESSPIAKAYRILTAFGPSANPALEFIARTAGVLGADTPARGLSRLAGPLQGVSALLGANRGEGINPEQSLLTGEAKLRQALSGQQVTDLTKTSAERRVDELALRDTGQPITSGTAAVVPYLQAKTQHVGPVWDAAMRDVSRERGLKSLAGWFSNQINPTAIVSQEEAKIRGARAELLVPQELSTQVRTLNGQNPMAQVDPNTYRQVQQLIQQLPPDSGIKDTDIQTVLSQPVAANVDWLFKAIYEYQQAEHPEMSGYSGGAGTPEARALQNQLAERRNVPASVPELRNIPPDQLEAIQQLAGDYKSLPPNLRPSNTIAGKFSSQISQGQDQYRKAHPMLDEYLNWLAARRGKGTVDQFLAEKQSSPLAG